MKLVYCQTYIKYCARVSGHSIICHLQTFEDPQLQIMPKASHGSVHVARRL